MCDLGINLVDLSRWFWGGGESTVLCEAGKKWVLKRVAICTPLFASYS